MIIMIRKGIPTAADLEIQAGALMMRAEARRIVEAGQVRRIRDARLAKNVGSIITRQIQARIAQDEEIRRSRAERSARLEQRAVARKAAQQALEARQQAWRDRYDGAYFEKMFGYEK